MGKAFSKFLLYRKPASVEDRKHPLILREDICVKLHNPFLLRNTDEVSEHHTAHTKPLVVFLDRKCYLGPVRRLSGSKRYITSAAYDLLPCPIPYTSHKCDSPDEVDFRYFFQFRWGEFLSWREQAEIDRPLLKFFKCSQERILVIGPYCPNRHL